MCWLQSTIVACVLYVCGFTKYEMCNCTQPTPSFHTFSQFYFLSRILIYISTLTVQFLGEFAKLRKATIIFVMPVRMEKFSSHWTDFDKTSYIGFFFWTPVEKIQVSFKSDNNNGYLTSRRFHIYKKNLSIFFLEWEMF
jgi:hypothetical protein